MKFHCAFETKIFIQRVIELSNSNVLNDFRRSRTILFLDNTLI